MMFFLSEGKKLRFLGEIFPNPKLKMADLTRPEHQKIDPTQLGSKKFDPDPSLV